MVIGASHKKFLGPLLCNYVKWLVHSMDDKPTV